MAANESKTPKFRLLLITNLMTKDLRSKHYERTIRAHETNLQNTADESFLMSHFSVAVFVPDDKQIEESVDKLLMPYSEDLEIEPYVVATRRQLIRRERNLTEEMFEGLYAEYEEDPVGFVKSGRKDSAYAKEVLRRKRWTDEELFQEAIRVDEVDELYGLSICANGDVTSIYNPNSKWYWYEIGGRYHGMLFLKDDTKGLRGSSSECSQSHIPGVYDGAFVSDIGFEAMSEYEMAILLPYKKILTSSCETVEYLREQFHTEEEYIERSTLFHTFAVVTPDGKWHAKGTMEWTGVSSETPSAARAWALEYHERFIKPAIENNWYMVIVDCHI